MWPARVLDLEGLVSPEAVGIARDELIHAQRPDYLVVRTDDASALLASLDGHSWFAASYTLVERLPDPNGRREFRTYRRTP